MTETAGASCPTLEHDEAIALIREGYSIFPVHTAGKQWEGKTLCSCGTPGCTGKHPREQFSKKATIDRKQVDMWYDPFNNPQPGIAVHLGKSHCWVLDIDGNEGIAELQTLEKEHGRLPETRAVISGSGTGRHYYFAGWVDHVHSGTLSDNIHIKGNAGNAYVVAPPTIHHSGNRYEYLNRVAPVDAPVWLLDLLRTKTNPVNGTPLSAEEMALRAGYEVPIIRLLNENQQRFIHSEGSRYMGYSPIHPSDNSREFSINKNLNRWTCWEHMAHGGLLELAAILAGICSCDDFTKQKDDAIRLLPLSGRKFKQAVQFCLNQGIPAKDLKRHISGGKYHGN